MDIAMHVRQNPAFLAFMAHPDFLKQAREIFEYVGLIKKVGETGSSLLELLGKLKDGKAEKVEKKATRSSTVHQTAACCRFQRP